MVCSRFLPLPIALFFLSSCGDNVRAVPDEIYQICESETGQSRYFVHVESSQKTGSLRYEFMGQDIRYRVTRIEVEEAAIYGVAEFESSLTGEVRGNPVSFELDFENKNFRDGGTLYRCELLQDKSRIQSRLNP